MIHSYKLAVSLGMFFALIMLCGGSGFLSYDYGYRTGQEISYNQGYSQGRDEGYQTGYEAGHEFAIREPSGDSNHRNPTYQEMKEFLARDATSAKSYVEDEYVCTDFAVRVNNNAEARGIRCGVVDIFYPEGYGHAIVAFETTDKGLKFIEPQFDEEVNIVVGKSYSQMNDYAPPPRDDTIKRFLISW